MKIGIFADSTWGLNFIKKVLNEKKFKISFVVGRIKRCDKIYYFCKKNKINFYTFKNVNSKLSVKKIESFYCDILVSMSYDQIFKIKLINLTKHGIVNCHAGLLPSYRGRNILNWALINGEKFFGITAHKVDLGIDTGEIILQKKYPIKKNDNYKTLLKKCYTECPKILLKSLDILISRKKFVTANEGVFPSYCKKRVKGDEIIDWNKDYKSINNFVKALINPGPLARLNKKNYEIKVVRIKKLKNNYSKKIENGTIVKICKNKLYIKCSNAIVIVDVLNNSKKCLKIKK